MSNQFFPTLTTSSWQLTRTPQWSTGVQTAVSGDRKRNPLQEKTLWKWTLKKGVLQTAIGDLQKIQNLYNAMYGRLDWFLWKDPEGDSIVDPDVQINVLGSYYWPVAFTHDSTDFDRFAYQLWECGSLEFEQVALPQATFTGAQAPNGAAVHAAVSYVTTHIIGTGYNGIASVSFGSGYTLFDSSAYANRTDGSTWDSTSQQWSAGVGPLVTSSNPVNLAVDFSISGSILGAASPADKLYVYDCIMNVTYENSTVVQYRPTSATIIPNATGTVTNAANAIDTNPATFAEIDRLSFGSSDSPVLRLSAFA